MTVALAASCGRSGDTFTVKGTLTDSLSTVPGARIIMSDSEDYAEEVELVDGKFTFTGKADIRKHYHIELDFDDELPFRHSHKADFIAEPGTIRINLNVPTTVRAGKLNRQYQKYLAVLDEIIDNYQRDANALVNEVGMDAAGERLMEMQDSANNAIIATSRDVFVKNTDNVLGAIALNNIMYELSPEEFDRYLAMAGDFIRENDGIQEVKAMKDALAATAEGKMFVDFTGTTPDGKEIALSDFVGKGKPALVDFWASWCGPCKAEMPNIKAVYEEFKDRVNVVSVAVWDGDNSASREVIDALGMTWNHIFTGTDQNPAEAYGIDAIPHIILFAPDGTILRRELRGEGIRSAIETALKAQ